jgi:hypothetical protein
MKYASGIDNMNDLLIGIEAELQRDKFNKELLIRECFILWQILVEGIACSSFSETDVHELLKNNFKRYKEYYTGDPDFNFLIGWIANLTFWLFDDTNEDSGNELLMKAYKSDPKNSLFKWAVRSRLNLKANEIANLKIDIRLRFDMLYNYGNLIKEYFLEVVSTAI